MTSQLELLKQRLRALRQGGDLGTIDEAATKLRVSRSSLGAYERGERLPDIDFLARLAELTNESLWELIRLRLLAADNEAGASLLENEQMMTMTGQSRAIDSATYARRALLDTKDLDPAWSLAIMEMATRGEITADGVDRLLAFVREWSLSDDRAWEWVEEHAEDVLQFLQEGPEYMREMDFD